MNTFLKRLLSDIPLLSEDALAWLVSASVTPADIQAAEHPFMAKMRQQLAPKMTVADGIAIIPVEGQLAHRPDPFEMLFMGIEDSRSVLSMVNSAARDDAVRGALLRIDSPGGMLTGGPEIADAVASMNKSKPVVAHIGGTGASLAYMIASQAGTVVANRSSQVGSIGVITSITDYSSLLDRMGLRMETLTNKDATFKGIGAPGKQLNFAHREYLQNSIESAFDLFKTAVLSARPQVNRSAMQGQSYRGSEAKSMGLVDRVGDEDFAMGLLRAQIDKGSGK